MEKTVKAAHYDYQFKIILLGSAGVGKTSLLQRFTEGEFRTAGPTIGMQTSSKMLTNKEGKVIKILAWDTAGQEKYKAITGAYYRGALGAIVVFDIADWNSFKAVGEWLKEIKASADANMCVLLVGNKADLCGDRKVPLLQARTYAEKHKFSYIETSCVDGSNVEAAFEVLTNDIMDALKASGQLQGGAS